MTLKAAVVGAGSFGAEHARAWREVPGVSLEAIADPDLDRARAVADQLGIPHAYATIDEALSRDIQVCSLASPGHVHLEQLRICADRGIAALIEKPVVTSKDEAVEVLDLATRVPVVSGHLLRYTPTFAHAKRTLAEGRLGKLERIAAGRFRGPDHAVTYRSTHIALMTMIHDIDLALWLSEASADTLIVKSAVASRNDIGVVDHLTTTLITSQGVIIDLEASWRSPNDVTDCFEITGSRGRTKPRLATGEGHRALVSELTELASMALRPDLEARSSARSGIEAVRVALAVMESADADRTQP